MVCNLLSVCRFASERGQKKGETYKVTFSPLALSIAVNVCCLHARTCILIFTLCVAIPRPRIG